MIPSSQGRTPSRKHKVYFPGDAGTSQRQSQEVNPCQPETNASYLLLITEASAEARLNHMADWQGGEEFLNSGYLGKGILCPTLPRITSGSELRSGAERDDSTFSPYGLGFFGLTRTRVLNQFCGKYPQLLGRRRNMSTSAHGF